MTKPRRVQLRRRKGWRMPDNTVKVDRTTDWGNPFVVGRDGTRADCVSQHARLMAGLVPVDERIDERRAYRRFVAANLETLRGRNLACWCPLDAPCHADVLLELANA